MRGGTVRVTVLTSLLLILVLSLASRAVLAQYTGSEQSRRQNLETCLSGRYPSLCNHSILSKEELKRVLEAERLENLKMCLDGRYPALCRHNLLTSAQATQVLEAEKSENLRTCLDGRYPALCRHGLLTAAEKIQVSDAERQQNLKTCLDGRYPTLCDHARLSADEQRRVHDAEQQASRNQPTSTSQAMQEHRKFKARSSGRCEDGHWIDDVLDDGGIVKLEDGSLWRVDDTDTVDSALWLPADNVLVCDGKMVNLDEKESVEVTPIR